MRGQPYELGHQLREHNKYEDILDVFINFLIKRAPTIFVLINMTLMIWLVQTIYSSRADSIPRSIYYFTPFFQAAPIVGLEIGNRGCREGFETVVLKTFPAIKQSSIVRRNLTYWDLQPITFCTKKLQTPKNFSLQCTAPQHYCSGYCVDNPKQCPITSIRRISIVDDLPNGTEYLYSTSDGKYKYVLSRESKYDFVVGLAVVFEERCANDFAYYEKFQSFMEYWNSSRDCGDQGRIPSELYHPFDTMPVDRFLQNNDLAPPQLDLLKPSDLSLGSITLIKFSNKTLDCTKAEYLSRQLKNELVQQAVKPTFTQSILIIAFVFFTVSWGWLIGYYCFQGSRRQKNMIVILMCIIELIVICFLYLQNLQMFRTEELIVKIANCIETQLQATSHWTFGITNSSPFLSIIYCCTCFLLLQIVSNFMDRRVYVAYYADQGPVGAGDGDGVRCLCC